MIRQALDIYDEMPIDMAKYIKHYGWHFTKKMCDYAVSLMRRKNDAGKVDVIEPITKQQLAEILTKYGIRLDNDVMCDGLYVANMCKADFLKKSITDEQHLAMYVKDVIDDIDAVDGVIMRKWYACMVASGIPIDWEEMTE